MSSSTSTPTPITILTGFLGSGKTTLILNLIPQLPSDYKLALLKNEFGDVAIDSELASKSSVAGVQELLNGCICCNLVGQLGDALQTLRGGLDPSTSIQNGDQNLETRSTAHQPDRIIIETSGSAFPATLALEVNRLARETGDFVLDGVVSVIDVENWQGYEDTSVTAKMQAQYTDLIILNKWEIVSERRLDDVLDRIGDLELDPPLPRIKSDLGRVDREAILGLDGALAGRIGEHTVDHAHSHDHQSEVEVISAELKQSPGGPGVDIVALKGLLENAPKDEIYRIKAVFLSSEPLASSDGHMPVSMSNAEYGKLNRFILNWAFGRWTTSLIGAVDEGAAVSALKMTIIAAKHESTKWIKKIQNQKLLRLMDAQEYELQLRRIA